MENFQKENCRIELVSDNLLFLKKLLEEGVFVDLIYIDPPFNSGRDYVDFKDRWGHAKEGVEEFASLMPDFLAAMNLLKVKKNIVNYLAALGLRCWYMHKLLKPTGSFYYHCDDTAASHVKLLLDYIFGANNFKTTIIWKRATAKSFALKNYNRSADYIYYYTKSDTFTFNTQYKPLSQASIKRYYLQDEKGRPFKLGGLLNPDKGKGKPLEIDGKIITPPQGRVFRWSQETLDRRRKEHFEKYGTELIHINKKGIPKEMVYLEESKGVMLDNVWTDINMLCSTSNERLGYPTQKPEALLERIILTSSHPGDLVADFYLGSGTTAAAAIKAGRRFIGCDINPKAIELAKKRLSKIQLSLF